MLQINNDHLKQFYEKCQKDKLIGVDTEFYRVDTYFPKLCLIQLSNVSDSIFLDPINDKINLNFLRKILFNTKIKKIFHAARQDIEIFFNIFKKIPRPIIDIQICLIALGYNHSTSYAQACSDLLNIKIDKKNQFIDWRKRPLSKNKILYAINDVKHLIPLFKKINQKLNYEHYKKLKKYYEKINDVKIYTEKANKAWEKIRFKPLNGLELNNFKRYCYIREKLAMQKDIPAKRVVSDSEIKLVSRIKVTKKKQKHIHKKLKIK